jgi:menaquinone-dependent protoporphyrinogen oxidase
MRAIIIYPSQAGCTEEIAKRIFQRMEEEGTPVDLYNVVEERADEIAIDSYDAVVLGSPSHYGHYDARIEWCIREYRDFLSEVPTGFFSVSHETTRRPNGGFLPRLHWQPSIEQTFPGANDHPRYSLKQRIIHWIAEKPGEESEPECDRESVDWDSVDQFAERFIRFVHNCKQPKGKPYEFTAWLTHPRHEYAVTAKRI